jgi:hypothetical protein
MTDQERLISRPPHDETFFSDREFVYDPDSDWGTTRTGLIVLKEGELWIHQAPVILGHDWIVSPLREYQRAIGKHVLCNARTGLSKMTVDPAPWLKIQETVLLILATPRDGDVFWRNSFKLSAVSQSLRKTSSKTRCA